MIRPRRGRCFGCCSLRKGLIHPAARITVVDVRQWLESTKNRGMALGLAQTQLVLERLELTYPQHILHVAGSNGKGTVSALMATSLCIQNVPNLLFTSPHVSRVEERVRINGTPISSDLFDQALTLIHRAAYLPNQPSVELTFFEVTYLVAMVCSSGTEVLILETGLGGRLDATRSGPATACLLTSISREHRDILGHNRSLIAREKAAIARPNCPLIVRDPGDEQVAGAIRDEAQRAGNPELGEIMRPAEVIFVTPPHSASVRDEAIVLAEAMFKAVGLPTDLLAQANSIMRWPARMQRLTTEETGSHAYLLDAAHNPSGLLRVASELEDIVRSEAPRAAAGPVWSLLFATSPQHDIEEFIEPLLAICRRNPPQNIVLTVPVGGRYPGVPTKELLALPWPIGPHVAEDPSSAVTFYAQLNPAEVGLVVSIGSLYLQGNILNAFGWSTDENLSLVAKN